MAPPLLHSQYADGCDLTGNYFDCPLPAGAELTVRIQPVGETIPLAQARVTPDPDGSFAVSITVPPTIRPGQAVASISNYWDIATCPEGASCASAAVEFTVAP